MFRLLRRSDATLVAALFMATCRIIPAEKISNSTEYLKVVDWVPDWVVWLLVGLTVGAWLFHPWEEESRLQKLWTTLTRKFVVEHLHAGHWSKWDTETDPMPETDVGVRLCIRFIRSGRFKLRLRLWSCTGLGRKPFYHVLSLGRIDAVKGQVLDIPLVDMGIPAPGWDHERKRGWGPKKEPALIGKSGNVAVLECEGILTQRHRFYIAMVNHDTGLRKHTPSIYVQDEDDNIWDTAPEAKVGIAKYG